MAESNDSSSTAETQKSFGEPGLSTVLAREVARRRTFAIISHPDAGKTTLTEKRLLYGGAIHLAGAVKSKTKTKLTSLSLIIAPSGKIIQGCSPVSRE